MVILIEVSRTATIILLFQLEVLLFITICVSCVYSSSVPSASSYPKQDGPFWKRPGCHRVGHTRTIAIPGCVKFDLTTNACRGYCLSYSLPSIEDIGPDFGGDNGSSDATLASNTNNPAVGRINNQSLNGGANQSEYDISLVDQTRRTRALNREHLESILSTLSNVQNTNNTGSSSSTIKSDGPLPERLLQLMALEQQSEKSHMLGPSFSSGDIDSAGSGSSSTNTNNNNHDNINNYDKMSPQSMLKDAPETNPDLITSTGPIEANLVPSGPKQDIISIGQCCSMIETEYVKVNVRCENGLRDYIFKSAKSCECFFCKKM